MSTLAYTWGQVVAVLDAATPRGLTPSAKNNAMACPRGWWSQLMALTVRPLPEELAAKLAELMQGVEEWPSTLTPPEQGEAQLGFWALTGKLPRVDTGKRGPGKGAKRDWSKVDWSRPTAEIAAEMACTRQAVLAAKKRRNEHVRIWKTNIHF